MKKRDPYYIYLGGSHCDRRSWRKDFQVVSRQLHAEEGLFLQGIDPFARSINEEDPSTIVSRDVTLLSDPKVSHVVLMSDKPGGLLTTGTACELILARSFGKPVIVITQDNKGWIHPFVRHYSSYIAEDVYQGIRWLINDIQTNGRHGDLAGDNLVVSGYSFLFPDSVPWTRTEDLKHE